MKNLKFLTINFQSVKSKIAEFHAVVHEQQPDIIFATETWLSGDVLNSEIMPQGYVSIRRDRPGDSHGGVMIVYRKDLPITRCPELEDSCESMWCKLTIKGRRPIMFAVIYKTKHSNLQQVDGMKGAMDVINAKPRTTDVIITGDFNQPNIDWEKCTVIKNHWASKVAAEKLLDFTVDYNLQQVQKEPTREDSVLDLVFTNNSNIIRQTRIVPGIGDHEMVVTDLNLTIAKPKQPRRRVYLRAKADEEAIRREVKDYQNTLKKTR